MIEGVKYLPKQIEALQYLSNESDVTSLANAYQWYHYEVEYPLPKPGPVDAHSVAKGIVFTTTTETFAPGEDTRVYLSIGSSNESVLPAAGYTVEISS